MLDKQKIKENLKRINDMRMIEEIEELKDFKLRIDNGEVEPDGDNLFIMSVEGIAPLQVVGFINDKPFYFRSRKNITLDIFDTIEDLVLPHKSPIVSKNFPIVSKNFKAPLSTDEREELSTMILFLNSLEYE